MAGGRAALVTGGGSGIGAAVARRLASDGWRVALMGRTRDKLDELADEIGAAAIVVQGDVGEEADARAAVEAAAEAFGRLDGLVNAAGIAAFGPIDEVDVETFDQIQRVNLRGPYLMIRAALPHLEKVGGSVVTVTSVSGIRGDWQLSAYNASKGGVSNLTRALALELAGRGVRVNAVAPSLTDTEMAGGITSDEDKLARFRERIPMGRPAEPDEIAGPVAFLLGNDARFVNGVILPVDGGVTASNGQPNFAA